MTNKTRGPKCLARRKSPHSESSAATNNEPRAITGPEGSRTSSGMSRKVFFRTNPCGAAAEPCSVNRIVSNDSSPGRAGSPRLQLQSGRGRASPHGAEHLYLNETDCKSLVTMSYFGTTLRLSGRWLLGVASALGNLGKPGKHKLCSTVGMRAAEVLHEL